MFKETSIRGRSRLRMWRRENSALERQSEDAKRRISTRKESLSTLLYATEQL
jgi:hypothetical protein